MTAKSPAITTVPATGDAKRPGWRTRWAERENERRRRDHAADAEGWRRRADELTRLRVETTCFQGCSEPRVGLPVDLEDDEVVFRVLPAAELVEAEARHIPGLPAPGLAVTPIATDPPTRALPRGLRVVDAGMAVVTDRRVAFAGPRGQRQWWYDDLTGPAHHPQAPVTLLHTSEGGKLAGLRVPPQSALNFRFYLTLAFADVLGDRDAVGGYLDELVTGHERARPAPPDPAEADDAPLIALLHDRRIGVAAVAVAMFATAAAVGTMGVGGPYPVTAFGAPPATGTVGTDVSPAGSASSARAAASGAPAATGPGGVVTSPQPGAPGLGASPAVPGATGGAPPGAQPSPGFNTPNGPRNDPGEPGSAPSSSPAPTPTPAPTPVDLCGAPSNPYGYNYCGGSRIRQPAADVCTYFTCIEEFWNGTGHLMQCGDGLVALVGPKSAACAAHGDASRYVYRPVEE